MTFNPSSKNFALDYTFGNLGFRYPVKRKVSSGLAFFTLMMLMVIAFLVYTFLFSGEQVKFDIVTAFFLLVIVGAAFFRLYLPVSIFLRQLLLKEITEVTYPTIKVQRTILGLIGLTKEYNNEFIGGIQAVEPISQKINILRYGLASVTVQVNGPINFVYKGKNVNLGFPLDYSDGREIVVTIHKSFPHYNK